jgi:hypothetical protein
MKEKINIFNKYSPEDEIFFNKILDFYKDRGLTEEGDEFILTKGKDRIHFPKWYEIPMKKDGIKSSVKIKDFIEELLIEEENS